MRAGERRKGDLKKRVEKGKAKKQGVQIRNERRRRNGCTREEVDKAVADQEGKRLAFEGPQANVWCRKRSGHYAIRVK